MISLENLTMMKMDHFKTKARIYAIKIFFLWLPFSLGCLIAIPISIVAALGNTNYSKNMFLAMDKLAAAVLSWSGNNTVSAECGRLLHNAVELSTKCFFCKCLCWILDAFDAGHCHQNAEDEGIIED